MLKVNIELHPFGDETAKKTIESIYIGNAGGDSYKACYHFWINTDPRGKKPRPPYDGRVLNFERSRGAIELTGECIKVWKRKKRA